MSRWAFWILLAALGWAWSAVAPSVWGERRSAVVVERTDDVRPSRDGTGEVAVPWLRWHPTDALACGTVRDGRAATLITMTRETVRRWDTSGTPTLLHEAPAPEGVLAWWPLDADGTQPASCALWTQHGPHLLTWETPPQTLRATSDALVRGALSGPPRRYPFARRSASGTSIALATPSSLERWAATDASLVRQATTAHRVRAQQNLRYGLSDEMSSRVAVPYLTLVEDDTMLFERDGTLWTQQGTAEARSWGTAPASGDAEILGIDSPLPWRAADVDGDGAQDLLVVTAGDGDVLLYRAASRTEATDTGPDHVLRVSGWVLHRWLLDVDGDGRLDLLLLETPRLGLLAQVGALQRRAVSATLTVRPFTDDGFQAEPTWSHRITLPIDIRLTRERRTFHTPRPLVPLIHRDELWILSPEQDALDILRVHAGALERVHQEPWPAKWTCVRHEPFEPAAADTTGRGTTDVIWIVQDAKGARQLALVRLP